MNTELLPSAPDLITRTLELEFGAVQFPCYGLFQEADLENTDPDCLQAAQERFSNSLRQQLQALLGDGAGILIVGDTLARLAADLAKQGFASSWLASQRNRELPLTSTENLQIHTGDILEFDQHTKFDCIVVQSSSRYLDQLGLLSRCRELLKAEGSILLFGEFLQDDSAIEYSLLPNLSSFKQLSQRLGYALSAELDYTASAKHSLKLFTSILEKHRPNLVDGHDVSDSEIESLLQEFDKIDSEFGNRRRCFRVFQLSRIPHQADEYALAEYGDIDAFEPREIAQLFEKSFDKAFDPDLWRWKYELGDGKCVIARIAKDGEIVGHYGGAPRHIRYFGSPAMAIQPCDVMVLPEIRRQYGKSSLFFKVAATFLEREIGNTVNHLLGFGFPNQKAMNIAIRLGLYEKTDDFIEVIYPDPVDHSDEQSFSVTALDLSEQRQQQDLDELWQQMCKGVMDGIIGVRNWQYIFYRYFEHPFARTNQYQCVVINDIRSNKVYAVAVLKDHLQQRLLMDLICPLERMPVAISVLNQLVSKSGEGCGLKMWITRGWLDKIKIDGATVNELGIEIPCNSWNPGPSSETLYGAWWLTAGDMDFI